MTRLSARSVPSRSDAGAAALEHVGLLLVVATVVATALSGFAQAGPRVVEDTRAAVCRVVSGAGCPPGAAAAEPVAADPLLPAAPSRPAVGPDDPGPAKVLALAEETAAPEGTTDGDLVVCDDLTVGPWTDGDDPVSSQFSTEQGPCTSQTGGARWCDRVLSRPVDARGAFGPTTRGYTTGGLWTCGAPGVPVGATTCEGEPAPGELRRCLHDGQTVPQDCSATTTVGAGGPGFVFCEVAPVPPATAPYPGAADQDCTRVRGGDLLSVRECVIGGHPYTCSALTPWWSVPQTWVQTWTCAADPDARDAAACRVADATTSLCRVGEAFVRCLDAPGGTRCEQPGEVVGGVFVPDPVFTDECGTAVVLDAGDVAAAKGPPSAPATTDAAGAAQLAAVDAELDRLAAMILAVSGHDIRTAAGSAALDAGVADLNGRLSRQAPPTGYTTAQPLLFGPDAAVAPVAPPAPADPSAPGPDRKAITLCRVIAQNVVDYGVGLAGAALLWSQSTAPGDVPSTMGRYGVVTMSVLLPTMTTWRALEHQRDVLAARWAQPDVTLRQTAAYAGQVLLAGAQVAVQQAGAGFVQVVAWAGGGPAAAAVHPEPADPFLDIEAADVAAMGDAVVAAQQEAAAGAAMQGPVVPVVGGG